MYRSISMNRVRGLDATVKDLQETLSELLLLNEANHSVAVSVYSMSYEEYCNLGSKL